MSKQEEMRAWLRVGGKGGHRAPVCPLTHSTPFSTPVPKRLNCKDGINQLSGPLASSWAGPMAGHERVRPGRYLFCQLAAFSYPGLASHSC